MSRAENALAVAGGAAGWAATLTLTDWAQIVAAAATAAWMLAQTFVLLSRQRCTIANCSSRKP